ncbi:MAG: hypothetical protein AB7L91_18375 [Dehalococcoidia bacterium]
MTTVRPNARISDEQAEARGRRPSGKSDVYNFFRASDDSGDADRTALDIATDHRQFWAHAALGLAALGAVVTLLPPGPGRLVVLLAFTLLAPGAALLAHLRNADLVLGFALALTASATTLALVSAAGLWVRWWHPDALHAALVVVTAGGALVRILRRRPDGRRQERPTMRPLDATPPALAPAIMLIVSLLLAAWAAVRAAWTDVTGYGLTVALGVPFIVAIVLPACALVVELLHRRRTAVLAAAGVVLVIVTQAVAPLILPTPEYSWTYKHFGVVNVFREAGEVLDPSDIYQQWPAFFSSAAYLSSLAEMEPDRYASWASLLRCLLNIVVLAAVFRALTNDRRVVLSAVFLSVTLLWIDQTYFAPQSLAYTLALGFFAIVLTYLRRDPRDSSSAVQDETVGPWRRFRAALLRGMPPGPGWSPRVRWAAMAGAIAVFAAITASHQLTPYIVAVGVMALGVLALVRPRWLGLLLVAIALLYFIPRQGSVTSSFSIFDGFDLLRNAGGNKQAIRTSEQAFSALAVRTLSLAMWALTALVALRRRREFGTVVLPVVLAFSPMVFLAVANYGGEAVYRVFIFSLPWCAFVLGLEMIRLVDRWSDTAVHRRVTGTALASVLGVAALAAQQGLQGQFALNRVPPSDVAVLRQVETTAAPGSSMALLIANAPTRSTSAYSAINPGRTVDPVLLDEEEFLGMTFTEAGDFDRVTDYVRSLGGPDQYLVVSGQMAASAEYFGLLPPGALDRLREQLRSSPSWRVVVDAPSIGVYRVARSAL